MSWQDLERPWQAIDKEISTSVLWFSNCQSILQSILNYLGKVRQFLERHIQYLNHTSRAIFLSSSTASAPCPFRSAGGAASGNEKTASSFAAAGSSTSHELMKNTFFNERPSSASSSAPNKDFTKLSSALCLHCEQLAMLYVQILQQCHTLTEDLVEKQTRLTQVREMECYIR